MIPGSLSKIKEDVVASADTITIKADFTLITGSTEVNTILTPMMGSSNIIFVACNNPGGLTLGESGNILTGGGLEETRAYILIWSRRLGKWYIHGAELA